MILIFILYSCKKEEQVNYQTIYPLPYLPVYPGSYWIYLDENGDTVISATDKTYILHSYKSSAISGGFTDPVYVPYWDGTPVYGYSYPTYTVSAAFSDEYAKGEHQVGFLSEELNQYWGVYYSQYGGGFRVVVAIDTSITVESVLYDHVIVVNDYGSYYTRPISFGESNYYAKNIGLIRKDIGRGNIIIQHLRIVSYFINH